MNDYIRKNIKIEDPNVKVSQNPFKESDYTKFKEFLRKNNLKESNVLVCYGELTYEPPFCHMCGVKNEHSIVKDGFEVSVIQVNKNEYMVLRKQRFKCKECGSTFVAKTNFVQEKNRISFPYLMEAVLMLKRKMSMKDIGEMLNVSTMYVARLLSKFKKAFKPNYNYLPPVISIDEFKSTRDADGAMSFIMVNAETGEVLDIVEDRRLETLQEYFGRYSKKVRNNVKFVVMDMYEPYMQLTKKMFKNAEIIIDKFHVVQLVNRSFNKTRITLMKKYNTKSLEYKLLKNNWKLLLTPYENVKTNKPRYNRNLRRYITQYELLMKILEIDEELEYAYYFYQDIYKGMNDKDMDRITNALNTVKIEKLSEYMVTSVKTLKKNIQGIANALKYNYTNGKVEGTNNKIKVMKRVAFGYRRFDILRTRILLSQYITETNIKKIAA